MKKRDGDITRRDLAVVLATASAAASTATAVMAQQPAAGTEDLVAAAREATLNNSAALRKFQIPLATEPSFAFRP